MTIRTITTSVSLLLILATPTLSHAQSPADRIKACVDKEFASLSSQTQSFRSQTCEVRARAGVYAGIPPSCNRQEEPGNCEYAPPEAWKIVHASAKPGSDWENASFVEINWNERRAFARVKVNGHGCDRRDDAIAKYFWEGTIQRTPTTAEINAIWKQCVEREIKQ